MELSFATGETGTPLVVVPPLDPLTTTNLNETEKAPDDGMKEESGAESPGSFEKTMCIVPAVLTALEAQDIVLYYEIDDIENRLSEMWKIIGYYNGKRFIEKKLCEKELIDGSTWIQISEYEEGIINFLLISYISSSNIEIIEQNTSICIFPSTVSDSFQQMFDDMTASALSIKSSEFEFNDMDSTDEEDIFEAMKWTWTHHMSKFITDLDALIQLYNMIRKGECMINEEEEEIENIQSSLIEYCLAWEAWDLAAYIIKLGALYGIGVNLTCSDDNNVWDIEELDLESLKAVICTENSKLRIDMDDIVDEDNNNIESENMIQWVQKSDSVYGNGKVMMDCNDKSGIHCSIFSFERPITSDTSDSACSFHTSIHHQLNHHSDKIRKEIADTEQNTFNLCETDYQSNMTPKSDAINSFVETS